MRIVGFTLLVVLALGPAQASDNPNEQRIGIQQKIAHKIKMVDHMLNSPDLQARIDASKDAVAEQRRRAAE